MASLDSKFNGDGDYSPMENCLFISIPRRWIGGMSERREKRGKKHDIIEGLKCVECQNRSIWTRIGVVQPWIWIWEWGSSMRRMEVVGRAKAWYWKVFLWISAVHRMVVVLSWTLHWQILLIYHHKMFMVWVCNFLILPTITMAIGLYICKVKKTNSKWKLSVIKLIESFSHPLQHKPKYIRVYSTFLYWDETFFE